MPPSAPPVDLSSRWVAVAPGALSADAVLAFLADERAGGTALFVGTPRRWTGDVETPSLDFDAYDEMATRQLDALVDQAFERWEPVRVAVLHRTGTVYPTEPCVIVGVASAHRAEAFAACRWLIDTLKRDVPIWKRGDPSDPQPRHSVWL